MARIEVVTLISAPPEVCCRLALDVELHQRTAHQTRETIVAGVTSGILQLHDTVTWRARHFGVWQELSIRVTELDFPAYFCDVQVKGAFRSMRHEHYFRAAPAGTEMRDVFCFESPLGVVGRLVNELFLTGYMRRFLAARNALLKQAAEEEAAPGLAASAGLS